MARHNGWVLIGRKDGEYYFCDSVFDHGDGFVGATGSIVRPVSEEEYEWASDRENVAERYCDVWMEMKGIRDYDEDEHEAEFMEWIDQMLQYDDPAWIMFDDSDTCDASKSFEALGIEHECTDCSGGGRIFNNWHRDGRMEFDEVYNVKALVAIEALEDGAVSADYAAKVVFS